MNDDQKREGIKIETKEGGISHEMKPSDTGVKVEVTEAAKTDQSKKSE